MEPNAQNGNDQGHYRIINYLLQKTWCGNQKQLKRKDTVEYLTLSSTLKHNLFSQNSQNEIPEKHFSYFVPQWDKLLDPKVILVKMETEPIIKKSNYQYTKLNKSKVVM